VNNELIKSNIRAQKALAESERAQREMQSQSQVLSESLKEKDIEIAKLQSELSQSMVRLITLTKILNDLATGFLAAITRRHRISEEQY
jgi:hypothetical protein